MKLPVLPVVLASAVLFFTGCESPVLEKVEQWGVFELTVKGPDTGNPYIDIEFGAIFSLGEQQIYVPGFYDGEGAYRIRFSPSEKGTWSYVTKSNHSDLDAISGEVICVEAVENNHGPLKVTNTYYLEYADGTPYFSIGTTAYQWTSVKQSIQEKTVATLHQSPFNKIRMCVFPKSYRYGNETEPWTYPYARSGGENNLNQPNYDFFRNFDKRIQQLLEMGIQADVILFHPYDKDWGYYLMGDVKNERYVRYMIARISAYRNVWWSLANEWDVPAIKEEVDWEAIGNQLMNEDPHQRLRGIHNWYNTEDHFYDHNRPWITHASLQTAQFFNIARWREMYNKPIMFDEMRYEGDVPSGWGNLTGEEMSSYFWEAAMCGAYPTHGETIQNQSDTLTEVRWWAKGGDLIGESPQRIAFFKSIMEQVPFKEMIPTTSRDTQDSEKVIYYQLKHREENKLTMIYAPKEDVSLNLELSGGSKYLYIIDTWNMEILEQKQTTENRFSMTTASPYTLLILSSTKMDL